MAVNQNVLDDIMATQPDEERLAMLAGYHKRPRLELDPVMNMVNEVIDAMWEKKTVGSRIQEETAAFIDKVHEVG